MILLFISFRIVQLIIKLLFSNKVDLVQNRKRFEDDFGPGEESEKNSNKPDDFLAMFKGDIGEDFKIGLSITKKSLKVSGTLIIVLKYVWLKDFVI